MSTNRSDRLLGEWSAVARTATPPAAPGQAPETRRGGSFVSVVGAGLLALALVAAVVWLGNREGPGIGSGGPPPPTGVPPSDTPAPSPTPSPTVAPTATPHPTGTPEIVVCDGSTLVPHITMWQGAAGSRIANVELTNVAASGCILPAVTRVQLVDGNDDVLIDGATPSGGGSLTIPGGGVVTTEVQVSNYCGPTPVAPVSLGFFFQGGAATIALPVSDTDATVPPCNGPGLPGSIDMHPWTP